MKTLVWLQAGSCGGCTMSVLERGLFDALRRMGLRLLWHPSLSLDEGGRVRALLDSIVAGETHLDILCVEGAALRGPGGTGRFDRFAGRAMLDWLRDLAPRAGACVAVGSCAAFGGLPAAAPSTDAVGLQYADDAPGGALGADYVSAGGLPVVNVSGCAPHPDWILETLQALAAGCLGPADLDVFARPRLFADHLAHHGCARNEFYEFKASAEAPYERGCLMESLGCKATQAVGDCAQRVWNGGGGCTRVGSTCIACTSPGFQNGKDFHHTPKIAGIPVGLPLDMPKAWFVALAALSKSATPARVKTNARSDRIETPPEPGKA